MRKTASRLSRMAPMLLGLAFCPVGNSANAVTTPNCPTDSKAIMSLDTGKGATIFAARPRDEVVIISVQYDRGQGWQWDGNPYQFWDARTCPGNPNCNDPAEKPYPQQISGAFDPIPGNGTLRFRIFARQLRQAPGQVAAQDFCVTDVVLRRDSDGTPIMDIIALPGEPGNTVIWFKEK